MKQRTLLMIVLVLMVVLVVVMGTFFSPVSTGCATRLSRVLADEEGEDLK